MYTNASTASSTTELKIIIYNQTAAKFKLPLHFMKLSVSYVCQSSSICYISFHFSFVPTYNTRQTKNTQTLVNSLSVLHSFSARVATIFDQLANGSTTSWIHSPRHIEARGLKMQGEMFFLKFVFLSTSFWEKFLARAMFYNSQPPHPTPCVSMIDLPRYSSAKK